MWLHLRLQLVTDVVNQYYYYCYVHPMSVWRDLVDVSGWLIGAFSAYWGVRQTIRAEEADRRERAVRALLHRRKGVQLVLGLIDVSSKLHLAIEQGDRPMLREMALAGAAEMTRAVSFFGSTLSAESSAQLQAAKSAFSSAVQTISIDNKRVFGDTQREAIRSLCLEAIFNLQAIRGELEMLDDLGERPIPAKEALR